MSAASIQLTPRPDQGVRAPALERVELKMRALALNASDAGKVSCVDDAIAHHLQAGGGRFRAKLALSASQALGLDVEDCVHLATACELLHNASLIHDDVQDGDRERRGCETVWSLFGEDVAICAGDLLLSAAYAAIADVSVPMRIGTLIPLLHRRVAQAIHGQTADLSFRGAGLSSFATYERVAADKSGSLLSLPLELPLAYAGLSAFLATARSAAEAFAIAYQIADDLGDVSRDRDSDGRGAALNAVLVLRAAGLDGRAEGVARDRAHALLKIAAETADTLPLDCGQDLAAAAAKLSARL